MLDNVAEHAGNLNEAFSSILYTKKNKIDKFNIHTEDLLIAENTYSSSLVVRTADAINETVHNLEQKLLRFQPQNESIILNVNLKININFFLLL